MRGKRKLSRCEKENNNKKECVNNAIGKKNHEKNRKKGRGRN